MRGSMLMIGLAVAIAACALPASGAATMTAYADEAELRQALSAWREKAKREVGTSRAAPSGALMMEAAPATAAAPQKAAADSGRRFDHQRADRRRRRRRHRQARRRASRHPAPRPAVHGARRRRCARAGRGRGCLCPRRRSAAARGTTSCWCPAARWSSSATATRAAARRSACSSSTATARWPTAPRTTCAASTTTRRATTRAASIGNKLVFYTPTLLHPFGPEPWTVMPGLRRWQRRHAAGLRAHPAGHARVPHRRRVRSRRGAGAAHRDELRPRGRGECSASRPPCSGRRAACSTCRKARSTCGPAVAPRAAAARADRAALRGVPHAAGRRRAQRAEDRRRADGPDVVPRGRERPPQRAAARRGPRRGHVGQRGRRRRRWR